MSLEPLGESGTLRKVWSKVSFFKTELWRIEIRTRPVLEFGLTKEWITGYS
jgi:hypothetical protein